MEREMVKESGKFEVLNKRVPAKRLVLFSINVSGRDGLNFYIQFPAKWHFV